MTPIRLVRTKSKMTEYRKNVNAWCVDCDADIIGDVRKRCADCLVDHVVDGPVPIGKPTGFEARPRSDQ